MRSDENVGKKYGRLTVLEFVCSDINYHKYYRCKCDCGSICIKRISELRSGKVVSCGCCRLEQLKRKVSKHNKTSTSLYQTWQNMKNRCYSINNKSYKSYGDRGIAVCEEWREDFVNFYDWSMTNGYKKGLTIDRINNNGNYCPENCRWVDRTVQNKNKRTNVFVTIGRETHCIKDWCEILKINLNTVCTRIYQKKLTPYEALIRPVKRKRK